MSLSGHSYASMSGFGAKADMTIALQMSAFDPKRTCPLRREYLSRCRVSSAQSSTMFLV